MDRRRINKKGLIRLTRLTSFSKVPYARAYGKVYRYPLTRLTQLTQINPINPNTGKQCQGLATGHTKQALTAKSGRVIGVMCRIVPVGIMLHRILRGLLRQISDKAKLHEVNDEKNVVGLSI